MDILSLAFYGAVCGLLAYISPAIANKIMRLLIGIGIGLLSAFLLPYVR